MVRWRTQNNRRAPALAAAAGLALAAWLAFGTEYSYGPKVRVRGFPVPTAFFHPDGGAWTRTATPEAPAASGQAANLLTGLVAPLIPYKIGEFLRKVKAELK